MRTYLLYPDCDVDWTAPLAWNEEALRQDLGIDTLLHMMAQKDAKVLSSATRILLASDNGDIPVIEFRQAMLKDCLANPAALRELYAVATEAADKVKSHYLGVLTRYPHWVLSDAVQQMEQFVGILRRLRVIAESRRTKFKAKGWTAFFDRLQDEFDETYLSQIIATLNTLKFRDAMILTAQLGAGNKGIHYALQKPPQIVSNAWLRFWYWLFPPKPPPNSFAIHPRDEAGHRALEALRDEGMALTAAALAQSKDHVRNFFITLRTELAFYIGCLNLHEALRAKKLSICFPGAHSGAEKRLNFRGLCDAALALSITGRVVGNDGEADGKAFVLVTGANQGGKSTFLRSVGLAQLMMQAGMFVPADSFAASVSGGVFTHFKREEDVSMSSGKFDEELARMSAIVDRLTPAALVLFNESFAATNEREGSEMARQVATALLERRVRFVFVTHLYDFAHRFYEAENAQGLFLRAERDARGVRSFKLREGRPLPTSFGQDLYDKIFTSGMGTVRKIDARQTQTHAQDGHR